MTNELNLTIEERVAILEEQNLSLAKDIANLIAVLLHNEILFVDKHEDGSITYKLNAKDGQS
jgi:hypothetical protein